MTDNTPGVEAIMKLVDKFGEQCHEHISLLTDTRSRIAMRVTALVESHDAAIKAHDDVVAEFVRGRHAFETVMRERDAAIKERDIVWRNYKELVYDFMPETECLPGSKCDSYGHDDDCPVVNAQASVHKLRVKCEELAAQNAALRDALKLIGPEILAAIDRRMEAQ